MGEFFQTPLNIGLAIFLIVFIGGTFLNHRLKTEREYLDKRLDKIEEEFEAIQKMIMRLQKAIDKK